MPKKTQRASKRAPKKATKRRVKAKFTVKTDKHILYQHSVQDADSEVEFMHDAFRAANKRSPLSLREDFCGTALLCSEWVKSKKGRTATGVDIDPKVLAWGTKHNLSAMGEPGKNITLLAQDVRASTKERFDVINALNFSYWVFKTRKDLGGYFRSVCQSLKRGGIFVCDAYGGWEAMSPNEDSRSVKRAFTYVWEQHSFDPIDHSITNFIHFRFKNGRKLERAFRYDWRFWTLPELQELLQEAGFRKVRVHWDQADNDQYDLYKPTAHAENQPAFVAYLVAER